MRRRVFGSWGCYALAIICFVVASLACPSFAHADSKQDCSDAYQKTQVLRGADDIEGAFEQAVICSRTCSKSFLDECASWKTDLERRLASIIVEAVDASGTPVTDGSVSLDGVPWLDQLGGPARIVSKGPHVLEVTVKDGPPSKKSIVIREGEKDRKITISIPARPGPEAPAEVHRIGPWVVGGIGAATLIGGAITGGFVLDAYSVTQAQCNDAARACSQEGLDAQAQGRLLGPVTTGLLVGGGALLATGIIWLIAAPSEAKPVAASFVIAPVISSREAGLAMGASW